MEDEEIKRQLGALRDAYVSLMAQLLELTTKHEAAVKILTERLVPLLGVTEKEIVDEIAKLGLSLHDEILLNTEDRNPNLAGELDRRDDKDIPTGEDSP
jgi:hypothetical protein